MRLFGSTRDQGSRFLEVLAEKIDPREFGQLSKEGGFVLPNLFPIGAIVRVLESRTFPTEGFYEYEWAIYESGLERLKGYSSWMQLYLASLYVYCNKRQQWGIRIESDYLYLMIELVLGARRQQELLPLCLCFLEWLHDEVAPGVGYDDYYCLLTWALLRRLSGGTDHPCFQPVVDRLLKNAYSTEELQELTVSDRGIEAWHELHERIPCPEPLRNDFEQIIWGMPATHHAQERGDESKP